MKNKKVFSLSMVITGTVIGAGFASGLEIWTFFGKWGIWGLFGVILCGIIISVVGCGIILGANFKEFSSYRDFCEIVCGKICGKFFYILGAFFMFSAFCIMISGSGAIFSQELQKSFSGGTFFMTLICFFIFLAGYKGIEKLNLFLTPIMILGIIILGIYSIIWETKNVTLTDLLPVSAAAIHALIYVSYNFLSVPPVVIACNPRGLSYKKCITSGALCGIILTLCGFFMYCASLTPSFALTTVPALTLARKIEENFGIFYTLTIYFSMLTTAVGSGFGVIKILREKFLGTKDFFICSFICICGYFVASFGFTALVNTLYTSIGYCALLLTFLLIKYSLKTLKKYKE